MSAEENERLDQLNKVCREQRTRCSLRRPSYQRNCYHRIVLPPHPNVPLLLRNQHPHHHRRLHPSQHHQQQEAGRKVCRKYRKVYIRNLQQQEYNKLLNIVPSLASSQHKQRIPKVTVIEETIRYIDQLHEALAERVKTETGGQLKITTDAVAGAAKDLFIEDVTAAAAAGTSPASVCSKCIVCESERSTKSNAANHHSTCTDTCPTSD